MFYPVGKYLIVEPVQEPVSDIIAEPEILTKAVVTHISADLNLPFKEGCEVFLIGAKFIGARGSIFITEENIYLYLKQNYV